MKIYDADGKLIATTEPPKRRPWCTGLDVWAGLIAAVVIALAASVRT